MVETSLAPATLRWHYLTWVGVTLHSVVASSAVALHAIQIAVVAVAFAVATLIPFFLAFALPLPLGGVLVSLLMLSTAVSIVAVVVILWWTEWGWVSLLWPII